MPNRSHHLAPTNNTGLSWSTRNPKSAHLGLPAQQPNSASQADIAHTRLANAPASNPLPDRTISSGAQTQSPEPNNRELQPAVIRVTALPFFAAQGVSIVPSSTRSATRPTHRLPSTEATSPSLALQVPGRTMRVRLRAKPRRNSRASMKIPVPRPGASPVPYSRSITTVLAQLRRKICCQRMML